MTEGQQLTDIPKSNSVKIILLFLMLFLNVMFFFLYKSIPFPLPDTTDLSLTSRTLIEGILLPQIQTGLSEGILKLNIQGTPYTPASSFSEWKKQNPMQLIFPEGKIRFELDLFDMKTFNSNLEFNGKAFIDTAYPGGGSLGFGVIDNVEQFVFIKEDTAFWHQGPLIVNKFTQKNSDSGWQSVYNPSFQFKMHGPLITIDDKYGTVRKFVKSENNVFFMKSHSDKRNNKINFTYNNINKLSEVSFNDIKVRLKRKSNGLITNIIGPREKIKFKYDNNANLISITKNGIPFLSLQRKSKTFPHHITAIKHGSNQISFKYGLLGRIDALNSNAGNLQFTYGEETIQILKKGQKDLINFTHDNKATFISGNDKNEYTYDSSGLLTSYVGQGMLYKFEYALNGNLIRQFINSDTYDFSYDKFTNTLIKKVKNGDILFQKSIENGVVASEFRKGYGEIRYSHDSNGRITGLNLESYGDYKFLRDPGGNITEVVHPNGKSSKFTLKNSKLIEYRDIFNVPFKFNYGNNGKLIEIIHPAGNSNFNKNKFSKALDFLPKVSMETFNINSINYSQNSFKIKSEYNEEFEFKLDPFRRIIKVKSDKMDKSYSYSENNLLSLINFSNEAKLHIESDNRGRVKHVLSSDGTWSQLSFNEDNNILSILMEKDLRTFKYDKQKHPAYKSINGALKYNFKYAPQKELKVYQIEFHDRSTVSYNYDSKDRISGISFNNRDAVKFNYPRQNTMELKFPNGVAQLEEYDENNYLNTLSISDKNGESIRDSNFFFRDSKLVAGADNGKRIQIGYHANGLIKNYSLQSVHDNTYIFSDKHELVEIKKSGGDILKKILDKNTNSLLVVDSQRQIPITAIHISGKIYHSNFSFLEINGMAQEEKSQKFITRNHTILPGQNFLNVKGFLSNGNTIDQSVNFYVHPEASSIYQFDENDKLKYIHEDGKSSQLTWTAFNQIKTFRDKDGNNYHYQYSPNGLLSSSTKNGKTTYFVYDIFGNIIEEIASTGRSLFKYIYDYERNRLLMTFDGKNLYFYHTDAFGSIINITDQSGNSVAEYIYSPYGEIIHKKEKYTKNRAGFLGMLKNEETGFYFTKSGYFNPEKMLFFPTHYLSILKTKKAVDFSINKNISRKIINKPISLENSLLKPSHIPFDISFNKEFVWTNFIDIPDDLKLLKNYLHHTPED